MLLGLAMAAILILEAASIKRCQALKQVIVPDGFDGEKPLILKILHP